MIDMDFLKNKKLRIIIGVLGLYLLSTGVSFAFFSYLKQEPGPLISPRGSEMDAVDTSGPKTEPCPLNGQKYTKVEKEVWEKRRPLGVMIENHVESRPQSGLSRADVVYEAIAEGGITRFLAIFLCGTSAQNVEIGPVRSARTYYLDWISEYGESPLYAHVGGANRPGPADALSQVRSYGWDSYNDLNQFSIGFPTFWRDYERLGHPVATEHTMYSMSDKLWEAARERGLTNKDKEGREWGEEFVVWKFVDPSNASGQVTNISFPFWEGMDEYEVSWKFDGATRTYKRENGGTGHIDFNNKEQLEAANIVVMFTSIKGPIDEDKHLLYTTSGSGKALIFKNGEVVEATWSKASRTGRTRFINKKGAEVEFVRGPVWIEVLSSGTKVDY